MCPQAEAVTERLASTWVKWWTYSLWTGLVLTAAIVAGSLAACIGLDALLHLPQWALGALFLLWSGLTVVVISGLIYRLLKFRRSLAATARRVELAFPELGSHLINLVQLAEQDGEPDAFRQAAVAQAAEVIGDFPFDQAAHKETRRRRFTLCMQTPRDLAEAILLLVLVLVAAGVPAFLMPGWDASIRRLLHPWTFVPAVGKVHIVKVIPGDTEVLTGSSLEISAEIDNPAKKRYPGVVFVRATGQREVAARMVPDADHQHFSAALPQVLKPLQYRLEIGDSQSSRYSISTYEKPTVAEVEVTYNFPPYLGRPAETVKQKHGDLEAPQLTRAGLHIHPSVPIAHGHVILGDTKITGIVRDEGNTLDIELMLKEPTTYTVHLFTTSEHSDPEPRVNGIRILPDAPPMVALVEPPRESSNTPGAKVNVVVRATDDNALGQVRLEWKTTDGKPAAASEAKGELDPDAKPEAPKPEAAPSDAGEIVTTWTKFPNPTEAMLHHELVLDPAKFKPGQVVMVRAVARDRREVNLPDLKLQPQESASVWHQVRLMDPQAKITAELAQLDTLRAAVAKILQEQIQARVAVAELIKQKADADAGRISSEVRAKQVNIQKSATTLVDAIGSTDDEDRLVIKRAVNKLALGEMLQAVQQAEAVQGLAVARLAEPVKSLTATQDRIIDVLRRLLNELRKETADTLAQLTSRKDTQLPPDVQDKLRELKDKLEEFLKQQKKVIEGSEELAKKPVDDFTEKDDQLLKDLAAIEDDWTKFLADKHGDLSKLPEQDFANPSLLQEMIEVQTELKMAKDALTKKTADIAVPLEQLGAEMAKEMTTNIEKWLPDTPDREKWSQEEPLTDDMKEAPMAELPKELEDIVGDLMESEEDLFDEMEDASSSWADSLDKGAGWDAMDGPISNNSARGVTGNRLPNTSEIAGRSGEGRSGKSSGEFVGDTAVGKGGRKTPTRLTPDAFVKGQVKDISKDPVGGATGGGKESGAGGEGLQGPVPNRPERDMGRLADKQASLRNKAEGVDLKFKVLKYHHADLRKLVDQMAAVEGDLRSGRYQNAMRRRDVMLDGLGQIKMYLKGEFQVRQDQSANLPTDIQKEILGSMQESSPAGWEELNRQYFERLGTMPAKQAAPAPASPRK